MSKVRRIYVEKRPAYAVRANELEKEFKDYLGLKGIRVRELVRYDIENLSDEVYQGALVTVFSEPPVDIVYEEEFPKEEGDFVFSTEYLPGQFDQRADSAEQCVRLLDENSLPIIRSILCLHKAYLIATLFIVTHPGLCCKGSGRQRFIQLSIFEVCMAALPGASLRLPPSIR
jgi:hypothetical protein